MVLNFAHRGSLTEAPENTVAAMKKALAHGVKAIELDVQLTKDNHLVLTHDHHVRRFNQAAKKNVVDYTLEEIKQIDIGSAFSKKCKGEKLATLEEILHLIPRDVLLNIEIKNYPIVYAGIESLLLSSLYTNRRMENVMISSFDHLSLLRVQEQAPQIPLGLLFKHRILRPWDYVRYSGLDVYSIHPNKIHVNEAYIKNCHQAGYKVFPYTVNDSVQYEQFVAWEVDGVFSNNPDIFSIKK